MLFRIIQVSALLTLVYPSEVADASICTGKQDIAFLVDTTTSVEQDVVMAQSLAIAVTKNFSIQENDTRIAYVSFGYKSMIRFSFQTFSSLEEVDLAIRKDNSLNGTARYESVAKILNDTMKVMELIFSDKFGSREDASRFVVFISNGKFTDELAADEVQTFLKQENINLLVGGVGVDIDVGPLEKLVKDKIKNIFMSEELNAREMAQRIHELTKQFCDKKNNAKNHIGS